MRAYHAREDGFDFAPTVAVYNATTYVHTRPIHATSNSVVFSTCTVMVMRFVYARRTP